jgi:hypothetical protein
MNMQKSSRKERQESKERKEDIFLASFAPLASFA